MFSTTGRGGSVEELSNVCATGNACYDTVRRFVRLYCRKQRDTFIPLDHAHVQQMEADVGKIYVDFPEGRRQVSVLILVWSCSNAPFAMVLPTERTESILEGMKQGFEFFGCIPREV